MVLEPISATDLLLNPDGSVYHLKLLPNEIAPTVILVGDPARAGLVAAQFDRITATKQKREFVTYTGYIGDLFISVVGTGIGAGNIDIVLNELDALVNIDLTTRTIKSKFTKLRFIRLGTCGGLDADIPVDTVVRSDYAISFDGLLNYYCQKNIAVEPALAAAIQRHFHALPMASNLYCAKASQELSQRFANYASGITLTCPGFYGAQGRRLRLDLIDTNLLDIAEKFRYQNLKIVNLEMETAAIYGIGRLLGHECISLSTVVANRATKQASQDMQASVLNMLEQAIDIIK
ncbi:MAG: nucleoside phosphorylase [Gammaproteobacteria bacterium]|nr:nucleoside phosphorylase [Gammaproteobacteria bacterium]